MKAACGTCGHVHPSDAARALLLFDPARVVGYRSALDGIHVPMRATRAEAEADWCATKAATA